MKSSAEFDFRERTIYHILRVANTNRRLAIDIEKVEIGARLAILRFLVGPKNATRLGRCGERSVVIRCSFEQAHISIENRNIASLTPASGFQLQAFFEPRRGDRYSHHPKISFEKEFKALPKSHAIEFKEKYLWE